MMEARRRLEARAKAFEKLAQHTPTPWKIAKGLLVDQEGLPVWVIGNNADFIVRAVNSHRDLIGAMQEMIDANDREELDAEAVEILVEEFRRLISQAEAK